MTIPIVIQYAFHMEIHAFNHSLATFCQFTTLGYKFFRNTKNPPPMKIMRNLSAFAALCQRIAMNSLILVILAQKGKLKSQDFIHRNDFSDSALQTFRLSPKERIKSYALTALQFRSIVLPAVPSVIGIELIRIAMQTPIDELSKFYLHIFHLQTVGAK